jgi:hypothetical protein
MDQLQLLKQNTTVNTYIDQYEQWMTQMKRERSYLPQDFFVDRFTSGLKDSIKHLVQCQKPETLLSAYWYARKYEQAYLLNVKKAAPIAPAPRVYPQQQPNQHPQLPRDNRNRPQNNNRGPRLCWYCNEFFFLGHRCLQMQRTLNTIELQGYDVEEENQGPLLIDPPPPAIHQVLVLPEQVPVPQQEPPPQAMPPDEVAMCISTAAYSGSPSDSTISLLLNFSKAHVVALADTGNTSTFMD